MIGSPMPTCRKYLLDLGFTLTYTNTLDSVMIFWSNPFTGEGQPVRPLLNSRNVRFDQVTMEKFANYCYLASQTIPDAVTVSDVARDEILDHMIQELNLVDQHDVYLAGQAVRILTILHNHKEEELSVW